MWISHQGEPADELPTPEQLQQWHRRRSPPDNELPAGVGLTLLLGRSDDAAVGITQLEAFSTGFQFALSVRLRRPRPELLSGRLFMLVSSHAYPGAEIPLEERLLLGLEYPDGRRASTLQDRPEPRRGAVGVDPPLVLAQQGGGGSGQGVDQTYWVSPLPPDGPVTVVLAWPAFGLPESSTVLDGTAIRAAADRVQVLWPPQPLMPVAPPPPPPRPTSGWFAEPSS